MPNEQVLRSRYNYDFPLTVKDPMTNEVIVGEVEFFLADKTQIANVMEQLALANSGETSAFAPSPKIFLVAKFFGSDFNYANNKNFRKKFAQHTQDIELINIGLKSDQNFLTRLNERAQNGN